MATLPAAGAKPACVSRGLAEPAFEPPRAPALWGHVGPRLGHASVHPPFQYVDVDRAGPATPRRPLKPLQSLLAPTRRRYTQGLSAVSKHSRAVGIGPFWPSRPPPAEGPSKAPKIHKRFDFAGPFMFMPTNWSPPPTQPCLPGTAAGNSSPRSSSLPSTGALYEQRRWATPTVEGPRRPTPAAAPRRATDRRAQSGPVRTLWLVATSGFSDARPPAPVLPPPSGARRAPAPSRTSGFSSRSQT